MLIPLYGILDADMFQMCRYMIPTPQSIIPIIEVRMDTRQSTSLLGALPFTHSRFVRLKPFQPSMNYPKELADVQPTSYIPPPSITLAPEPVTYTTIYVYPDTDSNTKTYYTTVTTYVTPSQQTVTTYVYQTYVPPATSAQGKFLNQNLETQRANTQSSPTGRSTNCRHQSMV